MGCVDNPFCKQLGLNLGIAKKFHVRRVIVLKLMKSDRRLEKPLFHVSSADNVLSPKTIKSR